MVDQPEHESAEGLRSLALGAQAERLPLVIVSGMSGAGRSTAAKVLEDHGWLVVDNLPPQLLPQLDALRERARAHGSGGPAPRLAVVIDSRTRWLSDSDASVLDQMAQPGERPVLVFLDATDEALVRRFESVRRPHPLQGQGRLLDGIVAERELLADLRAEADLIIDTSGLNVHQLTAKVSSLLDASAGQRVRLAVMSFGFKYGVPLDADFVMDMRFLPNPFWVPELRPLTGTDPEVASYVLDQAGAEEFLDRATALFEPVLAGYRREGRRYATIAIGCTGGKHRSVAVTEALAARFDPQHVVAFVVHRDLGRE